jgi:hypothetical protein
VARLCPHQVARREDLSHVPARRAGIARENAWSCLMNDRIRDLLAQIAVLDDELRTALHEQQSQVSFVIRGKKVEFERSVREAHLRARRSIFRWIITNRPQNFITGPIIYGLCVPLAVLDLFVSFYQATCFPIYGIAKVRRGDYIVIDRQHLAYLNWFERFHCMYCAYANGLIAYASEITARTEEYFCPIKHARKVLGSHSRYASFLAYGDAADYHGRLERYRKALGREKQRETHPLGDSN